MTDWEERFRAPRIGLPHWARLAPDRTVTSSNASGTWEVYTWTVGGPPRQVTDRPNGTWGGAIDPRGDLVWWFDDTDGDEFGVWRVQPYEADHTAARPAHPELKPGYSAGLALDLDGTAYVGRSDDAGTEIWRIDPRDAATAPFLLYRHAEDGSVADVRDDGRIVAISHSEHGDNRHPAIRLLTPDGGTVANLWDGPGLGLDAVGFAPGGTTLLVSHERNGRPELLTWDTATDVITELHVDLPGEIDADWYPDATALLVDHGVGTRSALFRHDLGTGATEPLGTPPGVVGSAAVRPDGTVWYSSSSGATPPGVRDLAGNVVVAPDGPAAPAGVPFEDLSVPTSYGEIPALLARPTDPAVTAPYAGVFVVHGGPTAHDQDVYHPAVAAWADAGYAVVLVNYRGSTGYGSAWRDALEAAPGRTELADIAAVRAHLVGAGFLAADRVALTGASWGGYLTLLGLGTQPDLWAAGVASVPVADYVAAYEDEMEGLKAFDRSLFGGSPEQVPEAYRLASPITYVDEVRVPLLVLAGENDPRCPIRQIDNYLARLAERGRPAEVDRFDAGHGSLVVAERIRQMRVETDFLAGALPPRSEGV